MLYSHRQSCCINKVVSGGKKLIICIWLACRRCIVLCIVYLVEENFNGAIRIPLFFEFFVVFFDVVLSDVTVVAEQECQDVADGDVGEADIPVCNALEVHVVDAILDEFFTRVGEILVFGPLAKGLVELTFDGGDLRSSAIWWDVGCRTGKGGVDEGWRVDGRCSGIFSGGEYGAQIAMGAPS